MPFNSLETQNNRKLLKVFPCSWLCIKFVISGSMKFNVISQVISQLYPGLLKTQPKLLLKENQEAFVCMWRHMNLHKCQYRLLNDTRNYVISLANEASLFKSHLLKNIKRAQSIPENHYFVELSLSNPILEINTAKESATLLFLCTLFCGRLLFSTFFLRPITLPCRR